MKADFERAAATYDEAAVLARETQARMVARLDFVRLEPRAVIDLGCASGDGIQALRKRYPAALPLAVDYARPMLRQVRARNTLLDRIRGNWPRLVNARAEALPLADACADLVWSNLMLHWLDDPRPAFAEMRRVLRPGGLVSFAVLGPDTLKELRAAARLAGVAERFRRFADMHDLGDQLVAAGFADPVMDMEFVTLHYRAPRRFLADQRHLGVRDGLLGPLPWRSARHLFAAWPRNEHGALPATFEVIIGHAWKGQPRAAGEKLAVMRFHPPVPRSGGADQQLP